MEFASRILSILLGVAVMAFLLWPVTIPLGFGEAWWASRQAQSRTESGTPPPAPAPNPPMPSPPPQAEAPALPPSPAIPQHAVEPSTAAPKPAEPSREKAKTEQLAALKDKDKTGTVDPQPVTKLFYRVTVRDGGTLQSGGAVIRLSGVTARDADATCKSANGKSWPCGAAAKAALTRLIRTRAVTCEVPKGKEQKEIVARCSVAGADLSTWMVRQGWAEPKDANEPALAAAAQAAKQDKLGLWRGAE